MPLQSSGPIKFSEIAAEFGLTPPYKASQLYGGGPFVPVSNASVPTAGMIRLSNMYNARKLLQLPVASTLQHRWTLDSSLLDVAGTNHGSGASVTYPNNSPVHAKAATGPVAVTNTHTSLPVSFTCWFRASSTASSPLISYSNSGLSPYASTSAGNVIVAFQQFVGGSWQTPGTAFQAPIALNVWYHLACTFSSTGSIMYVNGAQHGTTTLFPNGFGMHSAFSIGHANLSVSDFTVHTSVLTASEIAQLYAFRKPVRTLTTLTLPAIEVSGQVVTSSNVSANYSASTTYPITSYTVTSPHNNAAVANNTLSVTGSARDASYVTTLTANNALGASDPIDVVVTEGNGVVRSLSSTLASTVPNALHRYHFDTNYNDVIGTAHGYLSAGSISLDASIPRVLGSSSLRTSAGRLRMDPSLTGTGTSTLNTQSAQDKQLWTQGYTVSCFAFPYARATTNVSSVVNVYNLDSYKWSLVVSTTDQLILEKGDNNQSFGYTHSTPLTMNRWVHIALVNTGGSSCQYKLYLNGALVYTSGSVDNHRWDSMYVGQKKHSNGNYWPGSVDEVLVFGRVLSDAEVAALAATTSV